MNQDTIIATATPIGKGAIALLRLSGPDAFPILDKRWRGLPIQKMKSHTAHLGYILDSEGNTLDQALITIFRAPASFTGEDVAEISIHGSRWIEKEVLNSLIEAGATPAWPGDFSKRAFLNGKIDLAQAEGIADLIAADSRAAHSMALNQATGKFSQEINHLRQQLIQLASLLELELDFSEEDVNFADRNNLLSLTKNLIRAIGRLTDSFRHGKAFKEGIPVAIIGAPNVGKSSLLNTIIREDKAIVTDIPGTTRDMIEAPLEIHGIHFRFIDTAGIRETDDIVEQIGIERSKIAAERAPIILNLIPVDSAEENIVHFRPSPDSTTIEVRTKSDLFNDSNITQIRPHRKEGRKYVSAKTGEGIEDLLSTIADIARSRYNPDTDLIITNARHHDSLVKAGESLKRVEEGLETGIPTDLIAEDLRDSIRHLGELTGAIPPTTILQNIFSSFCIGK